MAGRVCVQFKDRRKASPLYPEEAILLPQTHRTMPFEQLLPNLVKEFWYSVSSELESLPADLPEGVKGVGLSINAHRAPKSGRICDLVTGEGPVNVLVTVAGAEPWRIFDRSGPLHSGEAEAVAAAEAAYRQQQVPPALQAPHKPVAARASALVPYPVPAPLHAAPGGGLTGPQAVPPYNPGMLNLSKNKRDREPGEGETEMSATEAIETLVAADLQYVMTRCPTPAEMDAPLFTATWLPMKPTYTRASGVKRGKYRQKTGEEAEEATPAAPKELTEEEAEQRRRFRQERAKAACAKRWALARERTEAIKKGLLDPAADASSRKAKKDKGQKEFRTMKLAKPLPQMVAIATTTKPENKVGAISRVLSEHGGVGFTCGICGAKLTSKESAVEHHRKSKKCVKARESKFKRKAVVMPSKDPPDIDQQAAGKLVTQAEKTLTDMTVPELKAECGARGLSNQGKKSELRTRVLNDINNSHFTQRPIPIMQLHPQAILAQVQQLQHQQHQLLAGHIPTQTHSLLPGTQFMGFQTQPPPQFSHQLGPLAMSQPINMHPQ